MQSRGCCGAVPGVPGDTAGDARQSRGSQGCCGAMPTVTGGSAEDALASAGDAGDAKAESRVPGVLWGGAGDTKTSAGDAGGAAPGMLQSRSGGPGAEPGMDGQIRGCRGAEPGMQEPAPGMPQGRCGGPGDAAGLRRGPGGAEAGGRAGTSLGAADLSQLGGPLALVAPEEGVGVLQAAAEGQLPRLGLGAVAAHLVLAVGQHLRHGGAERAEPRRAEPGAGLRRRRRRRGGNPGGRMKSCIRGERGPPPAGGGSGAPRPGKARHGRDGDRDREPRRRCPPGWDCAGGISSPCPVPSAGWSLSPPLRPPPQPCLCLRVLLNTGSPCGAGSPWRSQVPPRQTAKDHQAQPGPPPAHGGDAKGTPQCPTLVPQPILAPPAQLPASCSLAGWSPSGPSGQLPARLPPAPHLCPLPNTHPGTPSYSPPSVGVPP